MSDVYLKVEDLRVEVEGKEILKGVSLEIKGGEVHALMGPNGSGKSTLSYALAGHPRYEVTSGRALLNGEDLFEMEVDERSRAGLFLCFQYPSEISGVSMANFLRTAINARRPKDDPISLLEFGKLLRAHMEKLEMDPNFASRYLNEGFSGGEKKRSEILQMALLKPHIAILDETDSGLDIDALKIVAQGVNSLKSPEMGVLCITHYQRILRYLEPDIVHIMLDGRIVESGGKELAETLEQRGYDWIREQVGSV